MTRRASARKSFDAPNGTTLSRVRYVFPRPDCVVALAEVRVEQRPGKAVPVLVAGGASADVFALVEDALAEPAAGFSITSGVLVYFCDPRCPWQRGSNVIATGCCVS